MRPPSRCWRIPPAGTDAPPDFATSGDAMRRFLLLGVVAAPCLLFAPRDPAPAGPRPAPADDRPAGDLAARPAQPPAKPQPRTGNNEPIDGVVTAVGRDFITVQPHLELRTLPQ